jgi:hypothetical protein
MSQFHFKISKKGNRNFLESFFCVLETSRTYCPNMVASYYFPSKYADFGTFEKNKKSFEHFALDFALSLYYKFFAKTKH